MESIADAADRCPQTALAVRIPVRYLLLQINC